MMVKICGITRAEDARAAVEAGADYLGFIFAPSPRRVDPRTVARIRVEIPDRVQRVGVFVNEEPEAMLRIAREAGLTMIQLHGDESVQTEQWLEDAGLAVMKAIRVSGVDQALQAAGERHTRLLLIEPRVAGRAGGTGQALDAAEAARIIQALPDRRVFLAGGLGPDNVSELVRAARPWGVDASSRLEKEPGVKDHLLIKQFLEAVRS